MKSFNSSVVYAQTRWAAPDFGPAPLGGGAHAGRPRSAPGCRPRKSRTDVNDRHSWGWRLRLRMAAAMLFVTDLLVAGPGVAAASYVTISSPSAGATVKGTITIDTSESADVSWINVYVDGNWVASNPSTALPPYSVSWNSTSVPDGNHTISVTGYDSNDAAIASGQIGINVQNLTPNPSPTPRPTPTALPKPTPTPVSSCISITAPLAGARVSGLSVAIGTRDTCSPLWFESLYVDGSPVNAFAPGTVVLNTTLLSNGTHTVKLTSQSENPGSVTLGSASESLKVENLLATSSRTASPKPTATASPKPTPTPVSSCISITAPLAGARVSGLSVAIGTRDTCSGLWFEDLYVDGSPVNAFAPGTVVLNTTLLSNGTHTVKVTSQSENPGSIMLGSASESLNVENLLASSMSASPKPTAASSPKPTATAMPTGHLSNLPPGATMPSKSTCATLANQANFPETSSDNVNDGTGWDANNQIWTTPSYFYTNAGRDGLAPSSDFAAVDGNYSGTTQDIIRWAACKWGVDEDWAYAETAEETGGWTNACAQMHGGSTCNEGGDCGNYDSDSGGESPNLSFLGFPVTDGSGQFIGPNAYGGTNEDGSSCSSIWSSWSIIQSKARYFEWYTWPMLAISTAWGEDYRWAKYRACVNGDYANWFGNSSDYLNAVSRAQSNPNGAVPSGQLGPTNLFTNETNLQYLGLGCVATHFSGNWYDSGAVTYLSNSSSGFLYHLNGSVWPGGRR